MLLKGTEIDSIHIQINVKTLLVLLRIFFELY